MNSQTSTERSAGFQLAPKIGYEIPLNRHFYRYEPPRPLEEIESDIKTLESEILALLKDVTA